MTIIDPKDNTTSHYRQSGICKGTRYWAPHFTVLRRTSNPKWPAACFPGKVLCTCKSDKQSTYLKL